MSKTISFVASDELADFLEEQAQERMTTVSSTAQMLLAEKAREMGIEDTERSSSSSSDDVLDRHPDAWYRPNGKHNYAVYVPEDAGNYDAGKTRYYKTRAGASKALRRWYE